jgi:hypothetical protein
MAKRHHSSMIAEDRSAPCLLPRNIIDKEWEQGSSYHMGMVDTLYEGVQIQIREDSADFKKAYSPKKY